MASMTTQRTNRESAGTSAGDAISGLLAQFGLTDVATQDALAVAVRETLDQLQLHGTRMEGIRYKRLTLLAGAHEAHLIRFAEQQILNILQERAPDQVTSLNVRVQTSTRRTSY